VPDACAAQVAAGSRERIARSLPSIRLRRAAAALERLRPRNPLLFDFALRRQAQWGGAKLSDAVFDTRRYFTPTFRSS
jgi:hypothetical protein